MEKYGKREHAINSKSEMIKVEATVQVDKDIPLLLIASLCVHKEAILT